MLTTFISPQHGFKLEELHVLSRPNVPVTRPTRSLNRSGRAKAFGDVLGDVTTGDFGHGKGAETIKQLEEGFGVL